MRISRLNNVYNFPKSVRLVNSRLGVTVKERHVFYLFVCMRLHETGKAITNNSIKLCLCKSGRDPGYQGVCADVMYLSGEGFFEFETKKRERGHAYYEYRVTPLLVEYLVMLEGKLGGRY